MELLSLLWLGDVQTLPALISSLQQSQYPEDIAQGITAFQKAGYVDFEGEHLQLTEIGRQVRKWIEEETDRFYFTPWPLLTLEDQNWIHFSLATVCDKLPIV